MRSNPKKSKGTPKDQAEPVVIANEEASKPIPKILITKQDEIKIKEYQKRERDRCLTTDPPDWETVEAAVKALTILTSGREPTLIIRTRSPIEAAIVGCMAVKLIFEGKTPIEKVEEEAKKIRERELTKEEASLVATGLSNGRSGMYTANFNGWCKFVRENKPEAKGDKDLEVHKIIEDLATAGWIWWHPSVVAISARPIELHLDSEGNIHSESRPAELYADGYSNFIINGVRVPEKLVMCPEQITLQDCLDEQNATIKVMFFEKYGWDRVLKEMKSKKISSYKDKKGMPVELFSVNLGLRERIANLVKVRLLSMYNDTKEGDGTYKRYCFLVPGDIEGTDKTDPGGAAKAAMAWMFYKKPSEYNPQVET